MTEERASILVVDDQAQNLKVVGEILGQAGYELAFLAESGGVTEAAALGRPDLVLLDIMMPGKDGIEVCRELRAGAATRDIPVIFLTALASPEDLARGFEAGAVDYVAKPFSARELLARVRTHVSLHRTRLELERSAAALAEANRRKELLLKEIHHRVRNSLNIVASLVELGAGEVPDPADRDIFRQLQARIASIALIHERLYQGDDLGAVGLDAYLRSLADGLTAAFRNPRAAVPVEVAAEGLSAETRVAVSLGLIATESITNALKYAFPAGRGGHVSVRVELEEGRCRLEVADDGVGMAGGDAGADGSTGLGTRLMAILAAELGGGLSLGPALGGGSRLVVDFPAEGRVWR